MFSIKNHILFSKPKNYTIALCSVMALSNTGYSQIIYTNIEPDITQVESLINFNVDMNNDGIDDFGFSYQYEASGNDYGSVDFFSKTINVNLKNLTRIWGSDYTYNHNALSLDSNEIISEDKLWLLEESLILTAVNFYFFDGGWHPTSGTGYWGDEDNFYYLGVRFWSKNFYYGWVRLKVDAGNMALTVSDYAYNAIPEEEIKAGYKGGNLRELMAIYKNNSISVFLPEYMLDTNTMVELFNISGQQLFSGSFIDNKQIVIQAELFPDGIYIVSAYNKNNSRTAKIFIEK